MCQSSWQWITVVSCMHRPLFPAPTSLLLADSPGYSQQQVGVAMTTNDLGYSLPLLPSVLPIVVGEHPTLMQMNLFVTVYLGSDSTYVRYWGVLIAVHKEYYCSYNITVIILSFDCSQAFPGSSFWWLAVCPIFAYCKWSKTGAGEGLGMRLIMLLVMYNYLSFSCQNAIINCKFTIYGYIMSKSLDICISRSLKKCFYHQV